MGLSKYKLEEQIEKSLRESEGDFPRASQRLPKDFPITATRTFELIKLSTLSREFEWSHNGIRLLHSLRSVAMTAFLSGGLGESFVQSIFYMRNLNNLNISGYGVE